MKKDLFKPVTTAFALVPAFAESGQAATLLGCNSFDGGRIFDDQSNSLFAVLCIWDTRIR